MIRNIKFKGQDLSFDLPTEADQSVFDEIFRDNEYRDIEDLIIKSKSPILDLGAHKGFFSIYASTLNENNAQIYAFEAAEENCLQAKKNFKENHIKNVKIKNLAVWTEDRDKEFYFSEDSHNHSFFGEGEGKKIRCTCLESIFKKNRLETVGLVKMDLEGAEFSIIENASDDILKKVNTIFIEYHLHVNKDGLNILKSKLQSVGFKVAIKKSAYSKDLGYIIASLI